MKQLLSLRDTLLRLMMLNAVGLVGVTLAVLFLLGDESPLLERLLAEVVPTQLATMLYGCCAIAILGAIKRSVRWYMGVAITGALASGAALWCVLFLIWTTIHSDAVVKTWIITTEWSIAMAVAGSALQVVVATRDRWIQWLTVASASTSAAFLNYFLFAGDNISVFTVKLIIFFVILALAGWISTVTFGSMHKQGKR